jgi:hypothetical protein
MLIVLLDEAVGAVRTAVGPVVGREWFRGAEPVVGFVVGRDTRWVRVVLVVMSQGLVVFSGTWWSGLAFTPLRAVRRSKRSFRGSGAASSSVPVSGR